MQITDIKVRKLFDEGPMKAVISVTFDGQLAVHDIKVINARDRLFIVMPSRKSPDDTYRDIVHPITADFRRSLEEKIIEKYEEAIRLSETADEAAAAEITG
jgi:stage V sporulation protein G